MQAYAGQNRHCYVWVLQLSIIKGDYFINSLAPSNHQISLLLFFCKWASLQIDQKAKAILDGDYNGERISSASSL